MRQFLYAADLFLFIDELGLRNEFTQLFPIAFISPLRIPSVALTTRRAFADDRIAEFVTHRDKVLLGVRKCGSADALIVKMSWIKNLTGTYRKKTLPILGWKS